MLKFSYLSVENIKSADAYAQGVLQSLRIAFERIGTKNLEYSTVGLNVDRASVNTGRKRGLGMLIKQNASWLGLAYCYNHRLELALKDTFNNSLFGKIDTMLTKLYYLYQKSPKRFCKLKELSEVYNKTIPKPRKLVAPIELTIKTMVLILVT